MPVRDEYEMLLDFQVKGYGFIQLCAALSGPVCAQSTDYAGAAQDGATAACALAAWKQ